MSCKKPLDIVTRRLPDVIETRMMELFDCRLNLDDHPMSQAELVQAVKEADILVPTLTDRIDARLLSQSAPELKLIASFDLTGKLSACGWHAWIIVDEMNDLLLAELV